MIPEQAIIQGSVRTHDEGVRQEILKGMENLARGVDTIYGTQGKLVFKSGAPVGINDKDVCKSLRRVCEEVVGEDRVKILPFIMGSEDFYYFTQQCPGAMMRLGCASLEDGITHPLHSPHFDIHEDVLEIGVEVMYRAVENFFEDKA